MLERKRPFGLAKGAFYEEKWWICPAVKAGPALAVFEIMCMTKQGDFSKKNARKTGFAFR